MFLQVGPHFACIVHVQEDIRGTQVTPSTIAVGNMQRRVAMHLQRQWRRGMHVNMDVNNVGFLKKIMFYQELNVFDSFVRPQG